jgi:hypothetical protein
MQIINDGLPEAIFLAVQNDKYDSGESDYTPSSLNSPAYQRRLEKDNKDKIVETASSRIWALLGSAVHYMIQLAGEKAKHFQCERRFYGTVQTPFGEKKIGAQVDVFDTIKKSLLDFKVTSTYVFGKGLKPEWISQLNIGLWCIWKNIGTLVDSLNIVCIWKDWSKNKQYGVYPVSPCSNLPIPVWSLEETERWIIERIVIHETAMASESIDDIEPCSEEETWAKPTKFAVMKVGQDRAKKVFDLEHEAQDFASEKDDPQLFVKKRPGVRTRCKGYCSVSEFCPAYKAHKEEFGE